MFILSIPVLTSCAVFAVENRYDQLVAVPLEQVETQVRQSANNKPKLGLAFGGGGVRGFMHLGVIRALEESGIRADIVTGTSAGSIAASLYATNKPCSELEKIISSVNEDELSDFVCSTKGFVQGRLQKTPVVMTP